MADNARIEDLRKRYHENPRRFFAPLANEYRKAGFLDRAILLCEKHLGEQADNMNGLVVYGQTLFEGGRPEDARMPFERALGVDPENLIALRHLGDIARLVGDTDEARRWYGKLLEVDRRNDEVLELMEQLGGGDAPEDSPAPIFADSSTPLVSVAKSVSVSGGEASDIGMIDLDAPSEPPTAPSAPAGPGGTVVINAQALADRDREQVGDLGAETLLVEPTAASPTVEVTPPTPATPAKRGSLLDIDFDFSDVETPPEPPAPAAAPVTGSEAAEYGFAAGAAGSDASAETIALDGPLSLDAPLGDAGLEVETSSEGEALAPAASGLEGLELAEFTSDQAPLAGLEASEFVAEDVAPLADLDLPDSATEAVAPLAGLDRVELDAEDVEPITGFEETVDAGVMDVSALAPEPAGDVSDAPEPGLPAEPSPGLPLMDLEEPPTSEPPSFSERASAPRPRMTKADMASLPLLADYGLEDDEPAAKRPSTPLGTPAIVTETMATLYLQQGHRAEAISVYRQLVEQEPNNQELARKLAELEAAEMPDFEAPASDAAEPEPAPAGAAMTDVTFDGVRLRAPTPAAGVQFPAPAGPSARDFFGNFARRGVARSEAAASAPAAGDAEPMAAAAVLEPAVSTADAPAPVADTGWPLDALLGLPEDAADSAAAEVLAGLATFEGPSGHTGLDALMASPANPAPADASPTEPASPQRKSVPRASQNLKFDQFFSTPSPTTDAAGQDGGDGDDLDQFHGWLKGLKP